ncbi:MAG: hypothetical protein MRZ79_05315 [Bacteroidia bacterium]|nr:hypothetical protein [Bacteroidia bacterium]
MKKLISLNILFLILISTGLAQEDGYIEEDSVVKKRIDLNGNEFLQYYDEVYTEGFAWLIEDELFFGKEEWVDGFYKYALYIDPTEEGILVDSVLDNNENQIRTMKITREGKPDYYILRAWRKVEENPKIELELLCTSGKFEKSDLKAIKKLRKKWVKYSNAHKPLLLVNKIYAKDALYVNGNKVIQGQAPIAARYAYMNGPDWKISLEALSTVQVDANTIIEFGEYISNGTGNYVLFWKKDPELGWRVSLDFNF